MITDFLKTHRTKTELSTALAIVKEFKEGENAEEWARIPFIAWAKLEQLEEFLEHLVNEKPLKPDTLEYISATDSR